MKGTSQPLEQHGPWVIQIHAPSRYHTNQSRTTGEEGGTEGVRVKGAGLWQLGCDLY